MLKKISKLLIVVVAAALCLTAFVGCNGGRPFIPIEGEERFDAGCLSEYDTDAWTLRDTPELSGDLRITFFDGGFGGAWLQEMADLFVQRHPDVTIHRTGLTGTFVNNMQAELSGVPGTTASDIYIGHGIEWQVLAGQGYIANLNDLFESTVYNDEDGEPITFYDRIAPAARRTTQMRDRDGYIGNWQVPFVMGVGGLAYNVDMFDALEWQVPTTTAELARLANDIISHPADIRPFEWSAPSQYLWDSIVFDWWAQLAGLERELPTSIGRFNRYETFEQFNPNSGHWPELKTAWTEWYNLIALNRSGWNARALQQGNRFAQGHFARGEAAMIPAASYLVSELKIAGFYEGAVDANRRLPNIRMMPTPFIAGARTDTNGNPIRVSSIIEYNQNMIVSTRGAGTEIAKEFLRFMAEIETSLIFPRHTSGALLAFRYDLVELYSNADSEWEKSIYEIMKNSLRFSTWSDHPIYTRTSAGVWPNNHRYHDAANNSATFTPTAVFAERQEMARTNWRRWMQTAGVSS